MEKNEEGVENFLKFIGVVILGKLIWDALKKYRCPRCNYPVNKNNIICPNCDQALNWGGIYDD